MKKSSSPILVAPGTLSPLKLEVRKEESGQIISGRLVADDGRVFEISNGLPDLTTAEDLVGGASFAREYYSKIAGTYDENLHITFDLYGEEEVDVRTTMIDLLRLKPSHHVLEVSAGTGKDSEIISSRLGKEGRLTLLDISPHMLEKAVARLSKSEIDIDFVVGTACSLPFPDNTFDALYCFAGVGHFPDIRKGLKEMARVVKVGGRVVFCEKNVPPWLKQTEYGRILINNNPMFAYEAPLDLIPVEGRNVGIRWINGNVHYVVDYTVGLGEPKGNFDLELPGERGGTFRTRYYGQLEGVTSETKKLAIEARNKLGTSMHAWLDSLIKREAEKILGKKS